MLSLCAFRVVELLSSELNGPVLTNLQAIPTAVHLILLWRVLSQYHKVPSLDQTLFLQRLRMTSDDWQIKTDLDMTKAAFQKTQPGSFVLDLLQLIELSSCNAKKGVNSRNQDEM